MIYKKIIQCTVYKNGALVSGLRKYEIESILEMFEHLVILLKMGGMLFYWIKIIYRNFICKVDSFERKSPSFNSKKMPTIDSLMNYNVRRAKNIRFCMTEWADMVSTDEKRDKCAHASGNSPTESMELYENDVPNYSVAISPDDIHVPEQLLELSEDGPIEGYGS